MKATFNYGKKITKITEANGFGIVKSFAVSKLEQNLADVTEFDMKLGVSVLNKTVKLLKSLGFNITINEAWGFEWEVQIIATR